MGVTVGLKTTDQARPRYPITVHSLDDNDRVSYDNERDLACDLEWFDSEDPEEHAEVLDADGRRVHLKIERLEVKVLKLV